VRRGVDESLKALGTDDVVLFQVHWPDPHTPLAELVVPIGATAAGVRVRCSRASTAQ
jgi:aryl-alcohol dehydrogenase-like predicted oxidoreductase